MDRHNPTPDSSAHVAVTAEGLDPAAVSAKVSLPVGLRAVESLVDGRLRQTIDDAHGQQSGDPREMTRTAMARNGVDLAFTTLSGMGHVSKESFEGLRQGQGKGFVFASRPATSREQAVIDALKRNRMR